MSFLISHQLYCEIIFPIFGLDKIYIMDLESDIKWIKMELQRSRIPFL